MPANYRLIAGQDLAAAGLKLVDGGTIVSTANALTLEISNASTVALPNAGTVVVGSIAANSVAVGTGPGTIGAITPGAGTLALVSTGTDSTPAFTALTPAHITGLGTLATAAVGNGLQINGGTVSAIPVTPVNVIGTYDAVANSPSIATGGSISGGAGVANSALLVTNAGTVAADTIGTVAVSDLITNVGGTKWIRAPFSTVYKSMATQDASAVAITGGSIAGQSVIGFNNSDSIVPSSPVNAYFGVSSYYADASGNVPWYIDTAGIMNVASVVAKNHSATSLSVTNTATIATLSVSSDTWGSPSSPINSYGGMSWYISDASGNIPVYVDTAGVMHVGALSLPTMDVSGIMNAGTVSVSSDIWRDGSPVTGYQYSWYVADASGNIALGVTPSGQTQSANLYAAAFSQSVATGLTATGTGQGDALALASWLNVVSTVPVGTGVVLSNQSGREQIVINDGANNLNVYPPGAASIGGLAAGVPVPVSAGSLVIFFQSTATKYYQLVVVGSGMTSANGLSEIAVAGKQAAARANLNIPGNTVSAADPAYAIVRDAWSGIYAVTATSGSGLLTIANDPGVAGLTVSMSAGSNVLTLTATNDKLYHICPQPRHVGAPIAIPGAGAGGGWLVTTIQQIIGTGTNLQQIIVADPAQHIASGTFPVFPCFTASAVGKKMLLPGWGTARIGKSIPTTVNGIGYEPLWVTVSAYNAPNQVTVSANAPTTYTAQRGFEIWWGTDNTTGLTALFQDALNKKCRYASFPNDAGPGVLAAAWTNNAVYGNVICIGDSKTQLALFDSSGNRFPRRVIPAHATFKRHPRQSVVGAVHQKRVAAATSPVFVGCGDSMWTTDPAGQGLLSESPYAITARAIQDAWPDKTVVTIDRSIGATDWTDFWITTPGSYAISAWYSAGLTWNAQLATANSGGPADCYIIGQAGGNGAASIYEPAVRAQVGYLRSLAADGSGNRPDIVMMAQGARELFDTNGTWSAVEGFHYAARLLQSWAAVNKAGFLPWASHLRLMRDGLDPDYCLPRHVLPPSTQSISPTAAASLGYKCYNWQATIALTGTSIADAWTRTGTFYAQLSPKVDNVFQAYLDGSSNVVWQVNTWGMPSTCTPTITATQQTLATSGQRTQSITPSSGGGNLLQVAEAGSFSSGDVGSCIYLPTGNGSGAPWRSWIIRYVDDKHVYLADPLRFSGSLTTQNALIGGLSFIPEDAYGTNIQIPGAGAAGATLDTTITGYTDAQHVTLAASAGTSVTTSTSIWVGHISARGSLATASIPTGTTAASQPSFTFEVMENYLVVAYNYFTGKTPQGDLVRTNIVRFGGSYVPHFWCSGTGGTASVTFTVVAIDDPILTMPELLDYEAWAPDTTGSYEYGGSGTGHMAAGLGPTVYEPVARAQRWR